MRPGPCRGRRGDGGEEGGRGKRSGPRGRRRAAAGASGTCGGGAVGPGGGQASQKKVWGGPLAADRGGPGGGGWGAEDLQRRGRPRRGRGESWRRGSVQGAGLVPGLVEEDAV